MCVSQLIKLILFTQPGVSENYEMISALNHTECHCVKKDRNYTTRKPTAIVPKCKCPSNYVTEIDFEGSCNCVCPNQTHDCYLRYQGNEGFTISDQRLV